MTDESFEWKIPVYPWSSKHQKLFYSQAVHKSSSRSFQWRTELSNFILNHIIQRIKDSPSLDFHSIVCHWTVLLREIMYIKSSQHTTDLVLFFSSHIFHNPHMLQPQLVKPVHFWMKFLWVLFLRTQGYNLWLFCHDCSYSPSHFQENYFCAFSHPLHSQDTVNYSPSEVLHVPLLQPVSPLGELSIQYCTPARTDDATGTGSCVAKCRRQYMTLQQFQLKPACSSDSWEHTDDK